MSGARYATVGWSLLPRPAGTKDWVPTTVPNHLAAQPLILYLGLMATGWDLCALIRRPSVQPAPQ